MSIEAAELQRRISASVRDMLNAYWIQASAGRMTDKALEEIIFRAAHGILESLAPYPHAQQVALLPGVVRLLPVTFLKDTESARCRGQRPTRISCECVIADRVAAGVPISDLLGDVRRPHRKRAV